MKQFYFLFFLVFGLNTYSQIVNIPDENFKSILLYASPDNAIAANADGQFIKIDVNNDGEIQSNESLLVCSLNVSGSGISDLNGIESFTNLKNFNCENNLLTNIDTELASLTNLESLVCRYNQLTNLEVTQNTMLMHLHCNNNRLTSLDFTQNIALIYLVCSYNQLTSLDITQNTALVHLSCPYNRLTSLDATQNTALTLLACNGNQLTSLDVSLNQELRELHCYNNQLIGLFIKNGNLRPWYSLDFGDNPNLKYVCADDGDVTLVQSRLISYGFYFNTCHVNTYCSFTPNGIFYAIQGNAKFDVDNNGLSSNDLNIPNLRIGIASGSNTGNIIANKLGSYYIPVSAGSHTLTPQYENSNYFTVSPASTTISFPTATSPFTQDFCVTANGVKNDLEITIITLEVARPGFDAHYKIIYKNKGNQVANGAVSFSFDDMIMDLISSIPSVGGSGTNSLNWSFTALHPFETKEIDLIFNINFPMEMPAVNGGDILVYTATIVGATDETPNDNTFTLNQTVVNSYDPNDKTCLEGKTISPNMVGEYVHYIIRFENTGTFAAENVVIADVIDTTKFELNTLIPQSSSHDFFTRINGNKVEFIFENINLPFNDENNDGYVAFKIKTKPNLVVGNTFTNKANIYFDYNFPIITNTTSTTVTALSNQDFDFETNFTLYPNPAKDVLNIKVKNEIEVKSVSIYNTLGQIIMTTIHFENGEINISNLQSGSYFIKVFTGKGSSTSKFIKK